MNDEHHETCPQCHNKNAYPVHDQGYGLVTYECPECLLQFQCQYERDDDTDWQTDEWDYWEEAELLEGEL